MNVIVDTCVWSLALRRNTPDKQIVATLHALLVAGNVAMLGPIRQELLSGVADHAQFERLKSRLSGFVDIPLITDYFIRAAEFSNYCRRKGVQGSSIDFLICAVASSLEYPIMTTDADFRLYAEHLPITLLPATTP